jgi:hypothetical protein
MELLNFLIILKDSDLELILVGKRNQIVTNPYPNELLNSEIMDTDLYFGFGDLFDDLYLSEITLKLTK